MATTQAACAIAATRNDKVMMVTVNSGGLTQREMIMDSWKILELATKTKGGKVMNEVYKNGELQTSLTYNEALIYVGDNMAKGDEVIIEYASGRTTEFEPELAIARSWQ